MNKKIIGKAIECLACVGLFAATWRITSNTKLENELGKVKTELKVSKDALTEANSKLEENKNKLDGVENELNNVTGDLSDVLEELDSVKEELESIKNKVSKDEVYDAFLKAKNDILYGTGDARKNLRVSIENNIPDNEFFAENAFSFYTFEDGNVIMIEDYSTEDYEYIIVNQEIDDINGGYLKSCSFEDGDNNCDIDDDLSIGYAINSVGFVNEIDEDSMFNYGINENGNYYFYIAKEECTIEGSYEEINHILIYCEVTKDGQFVEYTKRFSSYSVYDYNNRADEYLGENFTLKFYYGGADLDLVNYCFDLASPFLPK